MRVFAELVIKYRKIIIAVTLLLTIVSCFFIPHLKVNPDVISYLPKNDEVSMLFDSIGKSFQGNTIAVIGYKSDNVFTNKSLNELKIITDTLKLLPGVSYVNSLINVIDIRETDSVLQIVPLIDEYNIPQKQKELDSLKTYVLSKELYKGLLVSEDASATVITVKILPDFGIKPDSSITKDSVIAYYSARYPQPIFKLIYDNKYDTLIVNVNKARVAELIKNKLQNLNIKYGKLYFGGIPYLINEIGDIIAHDIIILGILAFLIILIVLYVSFKSWRGVIMPIFSVTIAILWVLGLMSVLGIEISMITNVVPVVLLATGSAYTIHVVNRINETYLQEKADIKSITIKALSYITVPVFFAAITTIVGFISFIFGSYITIIVQFGIFTALGVLFSFIISVTFIPAFLSFFPYVKVSLKNTEFENKKSKLKEFLTKLNNYNALAKKYIITLWIFIIIIFAFGISRIERRVDIIDYFKKTHSIKKTENFLRETFGGTSYLYVYVKGDIQNLKTLQIIDSIQQYIKSINHITHTLSVVDILKEMNNVMGEGKRLPNNQDKIYNLWFLMEGQDILAQLVANGNTEALIQATINTTDSKIMADMVNNIDNYLSKYKNITNINIKQSGFPPLYKRLDESLINSQIYSLIIAIIFMFIVVSYILKSFKTGLLAIVPIVATIITIFGTMGWFHIPLDIATVLVASISMGIGVDYAIHLISQYVHEINLSSSHSESILKALTISGKAILINVLSVTLGFLVMLFSELVPIQRFGFLIAVTMITSGLSTLTLLVATLNLINIKK